MSESEVSRLTGLGTVAIPEKRPRVWLAIILVAIVVVSVATLTRSLSDAVPLWALVPLGILAIIGLAGGVLATMGLVHFGHMPRQRVFFESMIDGLDEACVVTDNRGLAIFANTPYRALLKQAGIDRLVGFENLYAGFPELADKIYRLSLAARSNEKHEEDIRIPPGIDAVGGDADDARWVSISVTPIGSRLGRSYALWRFRDVSDRRGDQEKAFVQLQNIIQCLDNAPAGFFSTRQNGDISYLNATLADWLGIDGATSGDGSTTLTDIVGGDLARMLSAVEPGEDNRFIGVFDADLPMPDGGARPVRILHLVERDEQSGNLLPSRTLVLPHAQAPIIGDGLADLKLSRLVNNAPVAIAELGANGVIETSNVVFTKLTDLARRGAPLTDIVAKENADALREAIDNVAAGVVSASVPVVLQNKDKSAANIVLAPAEDRPEGGNRIMVFVQDTSRHAELELQLAQSQKMQAVGQLAGGVAHDFNNVLTAIIGFSDLLLAKHRPTDPSFDDIMNIKQNANRAANLVRQLLAFSRRQTLRPQVMSLSDIMSDLGNLLGRLLGEKIELDINYGRELGLVKVDQNQFEQVVVNLAVNARDAMANEGKLSIRTSNISVEESRTIAPDLMPAGEYVLCEVEDNGSGMPPEVMDKIYDPFYSTKEVGKGTGLGLSTVYGIVKQTGGFIFCDSEVGTGTTFKIYLPRVYREQKDEEATTEVAPDPSAADMTGDATILLVEDEDAVRAFASRALGTRGFKVLEADCGETALEVIEEHGDNIDLILSDVVMPEMDGPTMLKEIRKRGIKTRFIFISGYAEEAFEKNLEGEDDFAFLPKPFSLKQLTEAVKNQLNS